MRSTKLAVVLFVEIADFGELLERDEALALRILAEWRALAESFLPEHGGELVDATGSELLVLFESTVSALQYGLSVFHATSSRSLSPEGAAWRLRAGVHLGEIWREGARVFGTGVNVAARVMQEARPGSILISEDVERQVVNKLDLALRPLPATRLKNIDRPLGIHEVLLGREVASEESPDALPVLPASSGDRPIDIPRPLEVGTQPPRPKSRRRSYRIEIHPAPETGGGEGGEKGPVREAPARRKGPGPEARTDRIERASTRLRKGVSTTLWGGLLVGGSVWFLQGQAGFLPAVLGLLGILPSISGLRKTIEALAELREIRKEQRRD